MFVFNVDLSTCSLKKFSLFYLASIGGVVELYWLLNCLIWPDLFISGHRSQNAWRVQKITNLVQASYKIRKAHSGPCDILPLQLILHFSFMSFVFKRQAFVSSFSNLCCIVWFSAASAGKAAETKTNDILAMISPEGERVGLTKVKKKQYFIPVLVSLHNCRTSGRHSEVVSVWGHRESYNFFFICSRVWRLVVMWKTGLVRLKSLWFLHSEN